MAKKEIQVWQTAKTTDIRVKQLLNLAISAPQYTMEAKRFILQLASQLFPSMFSKKMWEMMIQMEVMQTLLREEIGGRDHCITKCSGHVMPILNPQRKAIYNYYLYRCKWDARALAQPQLANCWAFFSLLFVFPFCFQVYAGQYGHSLVYGWPCLRGIQCHCFV